MREDEVAQGKAIAQRLQERRAVFRDREFLLAPRAFDGLLHLVRNSGQAILKEQLLDAIWPEPEHVFGDKRDPGAPRQAVRYALRADRA